MEGGGMAYNTVGYTETPDYRCLEDLDQTHLKKSTVPLALAYCGRENCEPGWKFGPYEREKHVIHVVTKGRGIFRSNGTEYDLSEGKLFAIYPGENTFYQADRETPWSYSWIGFTGYTAESIMEAIGVSRERPVADLKDTAEIYDAIERLLDVRQMTMADILKRTAGMYYVLALMIENSLQAKPRRRYAQVKYVSMAAELIASSYDRKIKVSEIADMVGVNRSYLTSIFKKEMNMSPQEFLINFRLEKAAEMLRETEEQIGTIASAVGYTDALTFSKAFKQKYGVTPSEFRQSVPVIEYKDKRGSYSGNTSL